jgi:hypothetical protein
MAAMLSIRVWEMIETIKHTFPHLSHMCGFSPVWTREWTVKADLWMNCLPQPG